MILTQDKTNVTLPNSEWPFGQIRDRDGITPGTPGSLEVYGDHHQFFEKLIRESTIIPNGVLDSEYNGYQLWDAFVDHVHNNRNYTRFYAKFSQSGTSAPSLNHTAISDIGAPSSLVRASTGKYNITFTGTPFAGGSNRFYSHAALGSGGLVAVIFTATNTFQIQTINLSGAFTDSILSSTEIYVDFYDA